MDKIEALAAAAHEVNRIYCKTLGDDPQPRWEDAPDWHRSSVISGVGGVLRGNTPRQVHEAWLSAWRADGWTYGKVKDVDKKEHPCMLPYNKLPRPQQVKSTLFVEVVRLLDAAIKR